MKEYKLIAQHNVNKFNQQVNEHINKGWKREAPAQRERNMDSYWYTIEMNRNDKNQKK